MIYTDLTDDGTGKGKVICKRHKDSFFLSSAECIFIAQLQVEHPNTSKFSATGKFSSKFVTVVISGKSHHVHGCPFPIIIIFIPTLFQGDLESNIHLTSYQVSNTCIAMVRDEIINATTSPSLMRVEESTSEHYVPEVFYKYKNEYNALVQEAAKPTFPVEYLILTVSCLGRCQGDHRIHYEMI
jgi:nuclear protein localization family protein 4